MDRQIKAERAWAIPFRISQELGGFSFDRLVKLSATRLQRLFVKLQLHRFNEKMSQYLRRAIEHLETEFGGNASRIWENRPSSAEVVYRFLQFDGIGPKIATMATNILARDFKIPLADHYSIDISADVHVRRVFARLGLVAEGASIEAVIYKARALHPTFPGLMDVLSSMGDRARMVSPQPAPLWSLLHAPNLPDRARFCGKCELTSNCCCRRGLLKRLARAAREPHTI